MRRKGRGRGQGDQAQHCAPHDRVKSLAPPLALCGALVGCEGPETARSPAATRRGRPHRGGTWSGWSTPRARRFARRGCYLVREQGGPSGRCFDRFRHGRKDRSSSISSDRPVRRDSSDTIAGTARFAGSGYPRGRRCAACRYWPKGQVRSSCAR
jgi:hypothetical protein